MTSSEDLPKNEESARPSPFEIALQRQKEIGPLKSDVFFWCLAWLATALSGSFYGLALLVLEAFRERMLGAIVVFFIPMIMGFIIAGMTAVPFVFTVAVVTWGFWLSRFRMLTAAIAGGWTGVVAARALFSGGLFDSLNSFINPIVLAGIFGAVGCPLFTHLMGRRVFARNKKTDAKEPWQFTLRDLFIHFTVLAVLISLWSCYFTAVRNAKINNQPAVTVPDAGPKASPAQS